MDKVPPSSICEQVQKIGGGSSMLIPMAIYDKPAEPPVLASLDEKTPLVR